MRKFFIISFTFLAGFFIHAFFFPTWFYNSLPTLTISNVLNIPQPTSASQPIYLSLTNVDYNKGRFTPNKVMIKKGYYIGITNQSDEEQMWLASNNPLLTTPRGYGKSEQLHERLDELGSFTITNKLNPLDKLIVVVIE